MGNFLRCLLILILLIICSEKIGKTNMEDGITEKNNELVTIE